IFSAMICFFWDLTSLRKSSMKSSGFGWEASSAVEPLAASFLADDEFCANAELVAANATNIRVITRNLLVHGFLPYSETRVGRVLPAIVNNVNSPACTIPIERHRVSLNRSSSRIVAAGINR